MQIQIISTSVETKPTSAGKSYQQLEVVFKNLTFQGKVEAKKLPSFGQQAGAFKTLSAAKAGDTFDITTVKNAAGYNDWTIVLPSNGAAPSQDSPNPSAAPGRAAGPATSTPVRSSYETPEERANRQVLIVRQSSLSAAISTLTAQKGAPKVDEVLSLAQRYSDFVFQVKDPGPSGFEDLPDFDVPEVS